MKSIPNRWNEVVQANYLRKPQAIKENKFDGRRLTFLTGTLSPPPQIRHFWNRPHRQSIRSKTIVFGRKKTVFDTN